ncbi:TonB-dependent receptor plug domain-containing protein [Massilia sp. Dwa41.01b]|nr:TonB-dependent receptor plug domain-containing protein [Massilia sp. Dwa41.01b]
MTAVVSNSAPARTPIALACAVSLSLFAGAALAAADVPDAAAESVSTVHVTGARFASDPALTPIGATVITADEIRNAGVTDVNAAIRKIGGVYGRQSFDGSPDFALDLRGFGTNSSQNMVVMVDGVRMNENELTGAVLSTIPVDTVERIEIMRGGSSVLYGEGATGGVINIITKRGADGGYHGSLALEAGQRHSFDTRASVRHGAGPLSFDLAAARRAAITTAPTTSSCKRPSAAASSGRRMARAWGCAPKARARMRVSPVRSPSRSSSRTRPRPIRRTTSATSQPTGSPPLPSSASAAWNWRPSCRIASAKSIRATSTRPRPVPRCWSRPATPARPSSRRACARSPAPAPCSTKSSPAST